jgi:hypothetical protein
VAVLVAGLGLALAARGPAGQAGAITGGPADDAARLSAIAPDVAGRPWLVHRAGGPWVWGRAGSRARTELPDDESGLAISDRWLASAISTPAVSRIRIRDLATGDVVVERELEMRASAALFVRGRLLVTGYAGGAPAADGGIVAIGVPDGEITTLVPAGAWPDRLGAHPLKGDFHLSGSGAQAAVNACGALGCDNVVIDVATLVTRIPRSGAPGFLRAVTDDALLLTDADGAWIKGVDTLTGREAWSLANMSLMEPAAMGDGRVIANVGGEPGWQVAAIDGRGRLAPVTASTRAPGPWVWPGVSSPTVAVLGETPFEAALDGDGQPTTLVRATDLRQVGTLVVQPGE